VRATPDRPRRRALTAVLLATVVAAACSSSRAPAASSGGPAPARRLVRIATLSPLSGDQSGTGEAIALGARLAALELRRDLRRKGLAVEVVTLDDRADVETGVGAAQRIVADPRIVTVVGPLNSDVALSVAPIFREGMVAMISPSSTHPALTELGYPNVFRVCGRDDVQGDLAARFARDSLGATTVWIAHDGTTYGRGIAEFFQESAERRGVRVLGYDGIGDDVSPALLAAMKEKAPDVVYFGGSYERAAPLFKEAREAGIAAKFLGSDGIDAADFAKLAGAAAVGVYYTSVGGPVAVHPRARAFAYDYKKKFGKKPEPFSAQAYDAAAIALKAILAATDDGAAPSREAVIAAIHPIRYFGYSSIIAFDERGDLRKALYLVMKVSRADPDAWDDNPELKRLFIAPPSRPRR
jgi:branched-chain amino acid transport system substrate-binding protein